MQKTACILLADGFEETEAIMPADILTRLGIHVRLVGILSKQIRGAHGINIAAENLIDEISVDDFDALILPGGLPGTINLRDSEKVIKLVQKSHNKQKICAAICAAPIVLRDSGIASGTRMTGYPTTEQLSLNPNFKFSSNPVEQDKNIITAIGMGQADKFAFAIARALGIDEEKITDTAQSAFIDL